MRNKEGIRGWFGVLNTGMVFVACLYIGGNQILSDINFIIHTIKSVMSELI